MKIVTANRLGDGVAVYFTGTEWSEFVSEAKLAESKEEASELLESAMKDERSNVVVAPYVIGAELVDGRAQPTDKKERVRAVGPSVRRDLNRPSVNA
ncbi:MAG: DUF2849 domain-containing protein [Myxococcota bacterium]